MTDSKWFQHLMYVGMLVVGVCATYFAAREIILYRAATTRFLPVNARILSHGLEHVPGSKGNPTSTWMPVISYEYAINDQIYHSNNVLPRPLSSHKDWAEGILAKYPIDTIQTAYYNPVRPNESYLHTTKLSAVNYGALVIGILFLLLGASGMIQLLWKTFRT
ncbi:MAG: DUF3592 domain-containing protein [Phycisphaerales bacterium]|nr:DUF3592 domain-containing protein [Phycisphaerales bacterium]